MNEAINYVITRMAVERSITSSEMQSIIEEAIHVGVTSEDPLLRSKMITKFGSREPSAGELIEEIAKMINTAHHDE